MNDEKTDDLPVSTAVIGHLSENVDLKNARLPLTYQEATQALAVCERVDECREWVNKTEAIPAYARMADDETLHKTAIRIKSRAIKRCGELLEQFQAPGARTDQPSTGTDTRLTQREVAVRAGMSKRQEATARNVANVPEAEFERLVELDDPPSVTQLAELGKASRPEKQAARAAEAPGLRPGDAVHRPDPRASRVLPRQPARPHPFRDGRRRRRASTYTKQTAPCGGRCRRTIRRAHSYEKAAAHRTAAMLRLRRH